MLTGKFVIFIFGLLTKITTDSATSAEYIFPCYYVYEPENLSPEQVPAFDLCTHVILIGCTGEVVGSNEVQVHSSPVDCKTGLRKLVSLKLINPDLKIMFSTGNSEALHQIVQSPASISAYADSIINLIHLYNLDGVDFDWEYPCNGDAFKFTKLLQAVRHRINTTESNESLLVSAAIGAGINTLKECFDLEGLSENLDFINVMCYDYNTIYNTKTAYGSPLYGRPEETGYDATLNSNYTINYLIDNKVPRNKIVLGLNAGGHTFQLVDINNNGFHAPVKGVGYGSGWSTYPELCRLIKNGHGFYDKVAEVLYGIYDDQWANTGDVKSARAKADWAREMGLAGVFSFCLNWDDLDGVCGWNVTFPIHRAVREGLFGDGS